MKRLRKILIRTILALLLLSVVGGFAVQFPAVQTWLGSLATAYLSHELGTEVRIGKMRIDLWAQVHLEEVYVEDQHGDTLLWVPDIMMKQFSLDRKTGKFVAQEISLESPFVQMKRYAGENYMSYAFIVDYFSGPTDTTDTSITDIQLRHLSLNNGRIVYYNENRELRGYGFDWNHFDIRQANLEVTDLTILADTVTLGLEHLAGKDISGFELTQLGANVTISPGNVLLDNMVMASPGSDLRGKMWFGVNSIDDFDFFEQRVSMNHTFQASKLDIRDIAYFSRDLYGWNKTINLSGRIRGTIEELKGKDVYLGIDENTWFKGNFDMDGLPDFDKTFITLDIKDLQSNKAELDRLQIPPFDQLTFLKTPDNFGVLGQLQFSGNFTGFPGDFVAFGKLNTAIGKLSSDISFREDSASNNYFYKGNISTTEFDLGKFYNDPNLGPLSSDLNLEGSGLNIDNLDVTFDGTIASLYFNRYTYRDIRADGTFRQKFFDGTVNMRDENAMVDFVGQIDFSGQLPRLSFESDIQNINLKQLHLLEDYDYSGMSGQVDIDSRGLDPDHFEGTIHLHDITYCAKNTDYFVDRVDLEVARTNGVEITLNSDIAIGKLQGDVDLRELAPSFQEILSEIIPHYQPPVRAHKTQQFDLELTILDFSEISGIFIPELHIAPGSRLDMQVDEAASKVAFTYTSDSVSYLDNSLQGLVLDAQRPDSSLYFTITTDRLKVGSDLSFEQFAIDARSQKDTIFTDLVWGAAESRHSGEITGMLAVRGYQNADFIFSDSHFTLNKSRWNVHKGAAIRADSTEVEVDSLFLRSGVQSIFINGGLSERRDRSLDFSLSALSLDNVNPFLDPETQLHGIVSGTASIRDPYGQLIFSSDLTLVNFQLNDYLFGDICLESSWENALRRLRLEGELEKNKVVPLKFAGYYLPDKKESPLDLTAFVDRLDLSFINEFVGEDVLGIRGFATGTLAITGTPDAPQIRGQAALQEAFLHVPYLNTTYQLLDRFGVYPDMFTFDHIRILDEEGAPGRMTGTILHNNFGDWVFDMIMDLETPMLAMNTTEEMNSLYFGKAYTTGSVNIAGTEDELEFDINLKSERGTKLAMPMNSSEEQTFENFIRFVSKDSVPSAAPYDLSGIKLKFELDITPDAQFDIIFDRAVGDVMSGRGKGHLNMQINNLSTFNMYGSVELTEGKYLFTLKNLLNKDFVVRPGGTISWYGDPFAADLNLAAVYKVSASLTEVIPDANRNSGQRVPVDLVLNLTGKMFNPNVEFDIELPQVDQITRSRLESVISTDQEKNRQAFALLVLRRFVSPPNVTATQTALAGAGNTIADNSSELLTNQISNWLSQISNEFNLGFNYRPGDYISNEEIALALSTQLFNDRLSLSGNFGVSRGNTANANPTNYIGDIRIEYKITKDGKIRLLVYNESNDFRMAAVQNSLYTQGVGLLYQEEFNTMEEFYCAFKNLFRGEARRVRCMPAVMP